MHLEEAVVGEGPREARLRPEWAALYPGIAVDEWVPVAVMIDRVTAMRLLNGRPPRGVLWRRVLDDQHFEFRGGYRRPSGRLPWFPEGPS
jgi:hypothetical protein